MPPRDRLASVWDETVSTREPVVIERRGHESVVLVPASEWEGLLESAHLLRSPAQRPTIAGSLEPTRTLAATIGVRWVSLNPTNS